MITDHAFAKGYLDIKMPSKGPVSDWEKAREDREEYWATFANVKADQFIDLMMTERDLQPSSSLYITVRNTWRRIYCEMVLRGIAIQ